MHDAIKSSVFAHLPSHHMHHAIMFQKNWAYACSHVQKELIKINGIHLPAHKEPDYL